MALRSMPRIVMVIRHYAMLCASGDTCVCVCVCVCETETCCFVLHAMCVCVSVCVCALQGGTKDKEQAIHNWTATIYDVYILTLRSGQPAESNFFYINAFLKC